MDKTWFNVKTDNIEIPMDELFSAIDRGIEIGRQKKKNKMKTKWAVSIASMAASLIFVSGFLFSPMTKVLASVPIIGSIYESLHFNMGTNLDAKNLVTELNKTASYKGVNVTLTSVYYDGVYIGITFKTDGSEGKDLAKDYEFYLYDKQEIKEQWGGKIGELQKVDDYYMSAIELEYPEKHLPKNFTLPITFTNMGGVEGAWQFDIKVTQLPLKTFTFENSTSHDEKYSFTLESIVIGESNIRLDYTTSIPMDFLIFKIMDDKGNELADDTLLRHGSDSAVFEAGIGDTKYLVICPIYRMDGKSIELEPLIVNVQDN